MVALKEFTHFLTLNARALASMYAELLGESSAVYASISLEERITAGRRLLKAVIATYEQQTSSPLLRLLEDDRRRWPADVVLPLTPLAEIECLGQTLTPVVTNLEAGKFLWQLLHEVRRPHLPSQTASTTFQTPPSDIPAQQQPTPSPGKLNKQLDEKLTPEQIETDPEKMADQDDLDRIVARGEKQSERKLAKLATQLETLTQVSKAISNILDVDELLQTVVDLARERFDLDYAHIYLLNETRDTLELAASAGDVGYQLRRQGWAISFHDEAVPVARAARSKKAIVIDDKRSGDGYEQHPLLSETRAELAVPITVGEQVLGVLDVQSSRAGRFAAEDEQVQTSLALQIAVALRNALLYQQAQTTVSETQALYQASADLNAGQSYDDILTVLRRYTSIGVRACDVSLNYFDAAWSGEQTPAKINLLARWSESSASGKAGGDSPASIAPLAQPLQAGEPVIVTNVSTDKRLAEAMRTTYLEHFSAGSALFIPLIAGGEWIGYIRAIYQSRNVFTAPDVRRMSALAAQAAVAAQSIQRLTQTEEQARREQAIRKITDKMRTATTLQDLVKTTAQELGQYLGADYSMIELGLDAEEVG